MRFAWNLALVLAAGAMAAGVWLGYLAWQLASQRFGMLSAALVLSAPMMAAGLILARPREPGGEPPSRGGALVDAIHRADASLRVVRLCRAHIGVAFSYVFVLGFCQFTGYYRLLEFFLFYAAACSVAAIACLPWLARHERRLSDERAEYRRLLSEVERFPASAGLL